MQPANLQAFTIESLEGRVRGAELSLVGTIRTGSAQEALQRLLPRIHEHVVEKSYASFAVDVRGLTFVNSSAIRLFVNWIALANRAAYKLIFLTERSITWHRLSFSVLQSLAPATVEIREGRSAGALP